MRNHKFRLSDMIPNSWFFKLRQIGTGKAKSSNNQTPLCSKKNQLQPPPPPPPPQSRSRKSYYFTRELESNNGFCINSTNSPPPVQPPRKSSQKQSTGRRRTTSRSSTAATTAAKVQSSSTTTESIWTKSDSPPEFSTSLSDTSPEPEFKYQTHKIAATDRDIVIEMSPSKYSNATLVVGVGGDGGGGDLPPIITSQKKKQQKQSTAAATSPTRKIGANSPGVRLRVHSPKVRHRQMGGRKSAASRRSLAGGRAVVKSSFDPQRDFRESMVEMIVENNMRNSRDLEDLLACYLCLNADEYHDLIIQVFKQIWFDLTEVV